jgi:hypothetical protein
LKRASVTARVLCILKIDSTSLSLIAFPIPIGVQPWSSTCTRLLSYGGPAHGDFASTGNMVIAFSRFNYLEFNPDRDLAFALAISFISNLATSLDRDLAFALAISFISILATSLDRYPFSFCPSLPQISLASAPPHLRIWLRSLHTLPYYLSHLTPSHTNLPVSHHPLCLTSLLRLPTEGPLAPSLPSSTFHNRLPPSCTGNILILQNINDPSTHFLSPSSLLFARSLSLSEIKSAQKEGGG